MKKAINTKKSDSPTYPKFNIASTHESDLNKAILQIERANISASTNNVLKLNRSKKKSESILNHISYIESTMPVLTNIMVAGITLRGNISKRANEHLSMLSGSLKACNRELAVLAANDSSLIKTPAISKLKKLLNHSGAVNSHPTYIVSETGCAKCCEVHNFETLEAETDKLNNVTFYTYKENANLCVAFSINSPYMPKAFEQIKISELANWLKTHKLVKSS